VSIVQDLRTRRRHRGKSPWQLVQTIGRLEREADENTCQMVAMATENDELRTDRNRIAAQREEDAIAAAATIDNLTAERDGLAEELAALKHRFGAQIAAEANANRIDVPPMVRDTSAIEDQATGPIYVRTLREAAAAGLLGPVTDPGRIH
jgi:uncharacterized coiled-coil DUF342 family protein